jgi:hypothetical protein
MTIWNILRPFDIIYGLLGVVCGTLLIFSRFGAFGPRQIWQPWSRWKSAIGLFESSSGNKPFRTINGVMNF